MKTAKAKAPIKPALRAYLIENQQRLEADAKIDVAEANETNRSLLNQLFVMAGGIVTLSSPIFIDRTILKTLSLRSRETLVTVIIAATLSIAFGFVQLLIERRFFQRSKKLKFAAAAKIARGEVTSGKELKRLMNGIKPKSRQSPDFFTVLQLICLSLAAVGFIVVMRQILMTVR